MAKQNQQNHNWKKFLGKQYFNEKGNLSSGPQVVHHIVFYYINVIMLKNKYELINE